MDLAKSAMLVSVTIINGGLLGERRDPTATALVEKTYSIAERRAKASKFLIDRKHAQVKAVVAAAQRVREVLYKYTMPWGDDKSRLLPAGVHEIFCQKIADAEIELRDAWEAYLQVYPSLVADSERELGDLFDRSQYPTISRARDLFSYKLTYWPIPSTNNFVVDIAQDAASRATATMALEIETRLKDAAHDLVERGKETVALFVDRLESFKSKSDGKLLRESLVNNCKEVGQLIEAMNITGNEDIKIMARSMQRLAQFSAVEYRELAWVRGDAISKGKAILAKMVELDTVDHQVANMVAEASEYEF